MDVPQTEPIITEDLLPGDLLFQLRSGGEAEWVISRLFAGRDGKAINHVGIYDGDGQVIEAVMPEVRKCSMEAFIKRSVKDNNGNPCIMVCRVKPRYSGLLPKVLEFAEGVVEHPYDPHYTSGKKSWYCSELVVDAFKAANNGEFLFEETPMSFRDIESGEILPYWEQHYGAVNREIPEGQPGSHPALLSCSEELVVVNIMGALPARGMMQWLDPEPGTSLA